MKKTVIFFTIIFSCFGVFLATTIGSFSDDFFKRPIIRIDEQKVYIIDQGLQKGFIFNRKNFKKIAEFGRKGEGPQEFRGITNASIDEKNIYISCFSKLSIFSKDGNFIKEIKCPSKTSGYLPLDKNFVGTFNLPSSPQKDYLKLQVRLFDGNLQIIKNLLITEIHRFWKIENSKMIIYWIRDCVDSFVYKDRLYVGSTEKGFYFSVFDAHGQHLYDIKKDDQKRKVTEADKQIYLKAMRLNMGEARWNEFKASNEIAFLDYYPEYQAFFVNDDKIYVFHYRNKNGDNEISILDLKGNLIKTKVITIFDFQDVDSRYHYVYDGKLYRMKEKMVNWELDEINIWTDEKPAK